MLDDVRIREAFPGRHVQFLPQAESTNTLAMEWLRSGAPHGAFVTADEQLKGRGRKGRSWHTPPGAALAVSIILHPPVDVLWQMSMLGAVAIADVCEAVGAQPVGIKWPNDVQIGGRKVSGVLPEAVWEGERLLGVVLGLGLNVRVDFASTELAESAVSLEAVIGRRLDRLVLLRHLVAAVDLWWGHLNDKKLFACWQERLITLGQAVTISGESESLSGIAEAVDATGALLVRMEHGELRRIVAGDLALGSGAQAHQEIF